MSNPESNGPLVERIPVYLSQEFSDTLHLIKSPLRDPSRPYNDIGPLKSATFKPQHNQIAFQYQLDKNDAHYNHNADNQIDTFNLQTTVTPKRANYVIGQRLEDAMILHPITAIHQLLPIFSHVDSMQQEYDNDLLPQTEDEETALKQVQIKVKRAEKVGGVKRVTHDTLIQSIRDEKAQNCTLVDVPSAELLDGNAIVPMVTPVMQAKWDAFQSQLKSTTGTKTMLDDDNDDIDCDAEVKCQLTQQRAYEDFQARQSELFRSEPLYRSGDSKPNQLTSYPEELNEVLREANGNKGEKQEQQKVTPLARFVAPFATHSPQLGSNSDARNTISLSNEKGPDITADKVLQFLLFSRVVTFKAIAQNLNVRDPVQFRHLQSHLNKICILVHGNYVLRSQYVYNHDGTPNNHTNKQQQHIKTQTVRLSLARTFIMHSFAKVPVPADLVKSFQIQKHSPHTNHKQPLSQHPLLSWRPSVSQMELSQTLQMNPKELLQILKEIAVPQPMPKTPLYDKSIPVRDDTIWDFKLPIDWHFLQTFPNLVQSSTEQLNTIINNYFPKEGEEL